MYVATDSGSQARREAEEALTMRRREDKYLVGEASAERLEALIAQTLPLVRFGEREDTAVTSVYLDRPDRRLSRDALEAPGASTKIRLKHYAGEAEAAGRCVLEVKRHRRGQTRKRRLWVERSFVPLVCSGVDPLPRPFRLLCAVRGDAPLHPVAVVSYQRRIYQASDVLRVTIDRDVRFHLPDAALLRPAASLLPDALPGPFERLGQVVVEVKRRGEGPDGLLSLLGPQTRAGTFSKFAAALAAQAGERLTASR